MNITNMSEETIEENLPDLSPHLEDGFSLRQLEILHDYAVEAFKLESNTPTILEKEL